MIFQITDFIFPSHTSSPTYFKMFRYSRFFFFFFHLRLVIIWTQKSDVVSGVGGSNSVIAWFPPGPKFSFRFQHLWGCSVFQTFSCSFFLMLLPHEIQHQSLLPSSDLWGTLQSPVITSLSALISLSFLSHHLDHMTNAKTTAILIKGFWVMPYSLSVFCEFPWNGRCSLGASKVPKLPNCPKCKNSSENNRLFKHNQ